MAQFTLTVDFDAENLLLAELMASNAVMTLINLGADVVEADVVDHFTPCEVTE